MKYEVLFPIINRLEEYNITYALGGSGLLYFLGLIDSVNDWDITVVCSRDTLEMAINGYEWVEQKSGDYPFASQYRLSIISLNIDFIGYFACYSDNEIINLPVYTNEKRDGINLSSAEVWYVAYYLMDRKAKANLILKYLKTNKEKVNVNLINELINTNGINNEIRQELWMLIH